MAAELEKTMILPSEVSGAGDEAAAAKSDVAEPDPALPAEIGYVCGTQDWVAPKHVS